MIPGRPTSARPVGRRVYQCPEGHEVSRAKGHAGSRPVCRICTTSPTALVYMEPVTPS